MSEVDKSCKLFEEKNLMTSPLLSEHLLPDPWLASLLHRTVYKLEVGDPFTSKIQEDALFSKELNQVLSEKVFLYSKVQTSASARISLLQDLGFKLVDTNLTFEKKIGAMRPENLDGNVRFADAAEEDAVAKIARESFKFSRFHLDRNIDKDVANLIKEEWVRNFFRGKRGDHLVVAASSGKIGGFLQLLLNKEPDLMTIDLIAVDHGSRGQGFGRDMITFCEAKFPERTRFHVGTQVANVPSVRMYESMGFRLVNSVYVFHYHHE